MGPSSRILQQSSYAAAPGVGPDHPDAGRTLHEIGLALMKVGRHREFAIKALEEALFIRTKAFGVGSQEVDDTDYNLSLILNDAWMEDNSSVMQRKGGGKEENDGESNSTFSTLSTEQSASDDAKLLSSPSREVARASLRPKAPMSSPPEAFDKYDLKEKLGRAVGRTAIVNAAILSMGPVAGFATGGALTAGRFFEGKVNKDNKEQVKAGVVYGAATTSSCLGQLVGGVMGAVIAGPPGLIIGAFVTGCSSGILAGAASEVIVDATTSEVKKMGALFKEEEVEAAEMGSLVGDESRSRSTGHECTKKFRRPRRYRSL